MVIIKISHQLLQEVDDDRAADSYGIGRLLDEMERQVVRQSDTGQESGDGEGDD